MATYEEIYGKRVDVLDSDPSLTSANEGQVWYNSTSATLKSVVSFASWVSGSNMIQGRSSINGNVGTSTASLIGGGDTPGGGTNLTEEYNGTGWYSGGNRATSFFRVANFGTQTAAVGFSGYNPGSIPTAPARYSISTENYDGSSWTAGGSFPEGIQNAGATGTQTAGLQASGIFGPYTTAPSSGWETTCNEYDGSSWTNGTAMPAGRDLSTDIGTLTAALMTCGRDGPPGTNIKTTFHYDGTNWTASTDAPTAGHGCMGFGTQTSAILCGGAAPSRSTQSILWDGTSWTTSGSLGTAKVYGISAGTTTAGMTCSGATPSATGGDTLTEEYSVSINTLTAAAWSSGPALNTGRRNAGGAGTQTAALAIGGEAPRTGKTESYDGSSWTEVGDLNTARNTLGATGSSTAALAFGGETPGPSTATETWNGSSWTTSPNSLNTGTRSNSGFGTTSAAINMGGFAPGTTTVVEEWGGTSWTTAPNALPAARALLSGFGIETAGVSCGGVDTPGSQVATSFEWGGSSWTTGGTMVTARSSAFGGTGSLTAGLVSGGNIPANTATAEGYDGTTWATQPSLSTARSQGSGLGPSSVSTAGLAAGGYTTSDQSITEEFTGQTETIAARTLTTS